MLVLIMLNMTPFYVEKGIFMLCPKEPHVGNAPHFFLLIKL